MSHVIEMTCNAEYVHGRVQKTQVLAEDDGSLFHVLTTFQAFMRAMGFSNETIERHVKADLDKTTLQGNDLSVHVEDDLQFDEERMDIIATNGNDGEHYKPKFGPDKDGWIEWRSGPCPVKNGTRVDIKYRNGSLMVSTTPELLRWFYSYSTAPDDIVAYMILDEEVQQ